MKTLCYEIMFRLKYAREGLFYFRSFGSVTTVTL